MKNLPHSPGPRASRAFTIAELLVALAIFTLAAVVLGRTVVDSLRTLEGSNREPYHEVMRSVRQEIRDLPSREALEAGGEMQVPFLVSTERGLETEMARVRWEAEIKATAVLNVFLAELNIFVEGSDGGNIRQESTLYIYRPVWADSDEQRAILEAKGEEFSERLEARGIEQEEEEQ